MNSDRYSAGLWVPAQAVARSFASTQRLTFLLSKEGLGSFSYSIARPNRDGVNIITKLSSRLCLWPHSHRPFSRVWPPLRINAVQKAGAGNAPAENRTKALFYDNWLMGEKSDPRALPGNFPCLLFSDEGIGSDVDCAPQRKKVNICSGVRISLDQWSSPMD